MTVPNELRPEIQASNFSSPSLYEFTRRAIENSAYKPRMDEEVDWTRPLYDSDGYEHVLLELGAVQVVTKLNFVRCVFNRKTGEFSYASPREETPLKLSNTRPDPRELEERVKSSLAKLQVYEGGFQGIKHLHRDGVGYVTWKGREIEHYSFRDRYAEGQEAIRLAAQCLWIEQMGRTVSGSELRDLNDRLRSAEDLPTPKYLINYNLISQDLAKPAGSQSFSEETMATWVSGTPINGWFKLERLNGNHKAMSAQQRATFPNGQQPSALRSMTLCTREDVANLMAAVKSDIRWMANFHGQMEVKTATGDIVKVSPPRIGDPDGLAERFCRELEWAMPFIGELPSRKKVEQHLIGKQLAEVETQRNQVVFRDLNWAVAEQLTAMLKANGLGDESTYQTVLNEIEEPSRMGEDTAHQLLALAEHLRGDDDTAASDDLQRVMMEAARLAENRLSAREEVRPA